MDTSDTIKDSLGFLLRVPGVAGPLFLSPDTEFTVKLGEGKLLNVRLAQPPECRVPTLVISDMGRDSQICALPKDKHLVAIRPLEEAENEG